MDKLDQIISAKRRHLATLKKAFDDAAVAFHEAQLQLSALEHAASLRPAASHAVVVETISASSDVSSRRGGRQYGSVSQKWRSVLADWVIDGNRPMVDKEIYQMTKTSLGLAPASVRQRVRRFCDQGYLELLGDGYRVTDLAIRKFGFPIPGSAPNENDGAPTHH